MRAPLWALLSIVLLSRNPIMVTIGCDQNSNSIVDLKKYSLMRWALPRKRFHYSEHLKLAGRYGTVEKTGEGPLTVVTRLNQYRNMIIGHIPALLATFPSRLCRSRYNTAGSSSPRDRLPMFSSCPAWSLADRTESVDIAPFSATIYYIIT